jgi:hypothetical protein
MFQNERQRIDETNATLKRYSNEEYFIKDASVSVLKANVLGVSVSLPFLVCGWLYWFAVWPDGDITSFHSSQIWTVGFFHMRSSVQARK